MLSLGIQTIRHIWDFTKFKPYFEKSREVLQKVLPPEECLGFLQQTDLCFMKQLSTNYKEMFQMDFVKPPYKTIYDSILEEGEAKGHSVGLAAGRKEGLADGELSKAREIAKSLFQQGFPILTIPKRSGFFEEIKVL